MKLKNQIKKDSKISQNELGKFCQDFGYIKLSAPLKEASKRIKRSHKNDHKLEKPRHYKKRFKKSNHNPSKIRFNTNNIDRC